MKDITFQRIVSFLGSPTILFWLLPYMMCLLVFGTLIQGNVGIYQAQNLYFMSWILWVGLIPLPAGMTVCTIFFLNLLTKFLTASDWSLRKSGIHLSHVGVIVLLIGGMFSVATRSESVLAVEEGGATQISSSFIDTEFVVLENDKVVTRIPFIDNMDMKASNVPFQVQILDTCQNCEIVRRAEGDYLGWIGPAKSMMLQDGSLRKQPEENLQGLSFEITGTESSNGKYISFLYLPKPPKIEVDGNTYSFIVERKPFDLPFSLKLEKFQIEGYASSEKVKNYTSFVKITEDGGAKDEIISMNKPLRLQGYTLYQTSFFENPDSRHTSVLTVVRNKGRLFPYLSVLLIALGLFMHVGFVMQGRRKHV